MLLAAALLLMAGLACNAIGGLANGADATPTARPTRTPAAEPTEAEPTAEEPPEEATAEEPTEAPTDEEPTEAEPIAEATTGAESTLVPQNGEVLFEDNFDEDVNGWDVDSDDTTAREFRDGIYAIQVANTVWFAWSNPVTDDMTDVHMAVTVRNTGGNDPAFGVICGYLNSDAFYFMGFGDDGFYAIARIVGNDFVLLTSDENSWIQSDQIEQFQDSYQLEGSCAADGTLTLVVDGVVIDQVQDSDPYGAGGIGLFVQSFDNVPVEVEFDDLTVTALE